MSATIEPSSHEHDHLAGLISDFPAEPIRVNAAINLLHTRYKSIAVEAIIPHLVLLDTVQFQAYFQQLPRALHRQLYAQILNNNGQYRQSTDPNGGVIFFGRNQRFRGYPPEKIKAGIIEACNYLVQEDATPIHNVLIFYQQFVMVYPFYDMNGRIARIMTAIYLDYHGYYLSWEQLRKNSKWLKRLNDCHVRYGGHDYDQYISYLVQHWQKFIRPKSAISSE